jgi:hypothetical protein
MQPRAFHKLFREWMALLAVLAMVLGPLALLTSRSLAAQERVNVAAGLASLPVCTPGDSIDGLAAKTGGGACDHCMPAHGAAPAVIEVQPGACAFASTVFPANTGPSALLSQLVLPPATGPPAF